ncbi:Transcriptional regulator, contains XRE-family HTH domain [Hathewaya proteolytica DSM 3090]|uniref:Transcriptional regulator, contains XRE-family HTH domain n=1 Tax=Hathewaya proteolytica DSM 3090 TaxID=1121331 RepID=A0A1M6S4A7_9CLOT|nr:helix-turn-helix transcriptional regulator [Hathewaya proteolytica]SHK39530.1 Transcriptional regulator, contains XRE-family HTH domain [Hathewaya proteolytica DSM 3090]
MNVGERIKSLRISKGLTQDELANKIGVKKAAVYKYESGIIENIKRSTIQEMAKIFEVSPCYLLGWEDDSSQLFKLEYEEKALLENFRKLNNFGKNEAKKRVEELTYINKYIHNDEMCAAVAEEKAEYLIPVAAHADDLTEEEKDEANKLFDEFYDKCKR